jgi:hypothetical protein
MGTPAASWIPSFVGPTALADFVLVVHFAFVLFIVGGVGLIFAGGVLGWRWIRNAGFRYTHLAAIVFVAVEALVGMACPLTVWEDALRQATPAAPTFIGRWVSRLLYYDLPGWVFTVIYVLFAIAVGVTLWLIPPRSARGMKL